DRRLQMVHRTRSKRSYRSASRPSNRRPPPGIRTLLLRIYMAHPPVVVVDEHDREIGAAMLAEVWEKGLYHRIVHVIAEDEQGRVLLQHRAANARLWPNCWDHSAGGHVDEGYTYKQAAKAEVAEELGLHDVALEEI